MILDDLKTLVGDDMVAGIRKAVNQVILASVKDDSISPQGLGIAIYALTYNLIARAAASGEDDLFNSVADMLLAVNIESMMRAVTQGAEEVESLIALEGLIGGLGIDRPKEE